MEPTTATPETDKASNSRELLAFPTEVPEDGWSSEADMLMQINETLNEINDAIIVLTNGITQMATVMAQAAEAAGEYIARLESEK
jgi:hypothetical protein